MTERKVEHNPESGVLPLDDLPPVAGKKTNRSAFPMIGAPTILLTNLIGFSAVVNRASRVAELQIYDRGTSCAGFATGLSTPPTGTIRPCRITYSRLPQRIRFEPKLATQITK